MGKSPKMPFKHLIVFLISDPLDFFFLDRNTGELKTAKPLDREALEDPSSPLNLTVRVSTVLNEIKENTRREPCGCRRHEILKAHFNLSL